MANLLSSLPPPHNPFSMFLTEKSNWDKLFSWLLRVYRLMSKFFRMVDKPSMIEYSLPLQPGSLQHPPHLKLQKFPQSTMVFKASAVSVQNASHSCLSGKYATHLSNLHLIITSSATESSIPSFEIQLYLKQAHYSIFKILL